MITDVSVGALRNVRAALLNFQSDVTGLSSRASACGQAVLAECQWAIGQAGKDVQESRSTVDNIKRDIAFLEGKLSAAQQEVNAIIYRLPWLAKQIDELEAQIDALNVQLHSLRSQPSNPQDPDGQASLSDQAHSLENEISELQEQRDQLQVERNEAERRKYWLWDEIKKLERELGMADNELRKEERRCQQLEDKLARLKSAMVQVESEVAAYIDAVRRLEQRSGGRAQHNVNAVEKCIAGIEAYLTTYL